MFYRIRDGCRREEGRAVPNRWPRKLEGEGGIECVGGGVWRRQTLRSEYQLGISMNELPYRLLQITLKEQLTNCKRLVYNP
jgi:hypothetical protein